MDQSALGKRIKALRSAKGWTLREAAEKSGEPFQTLGNLETGHLRNPTFDLLNRVAKTYGADMDIIFIDLEQPAPPPARSFEDPKRAAIAARFEAVLPLIPEEEADVFVHELALWEKRYGRSKTS